jgi:Histidine kinase-, DNA gyrase B-, and HSP90-like ATPase
MLVPISSPLQAQETWREQSTPVLIGKNILELLSSSMYIEPLTIYREYIQNSADAIDAARRKGVLPPAVPGEVDIHIDYPQRTIRIRDNGVGLHSDEFDETLTAFGASPKRGSPARGFRGVGRLAGTGYCQELVFRSRAAGERRVNEMLWDCRGIKALLRNGDPRGKLTDLIHKAVRVRQVNTDGWPEHFFEVELRAVVRHGNDELLNNAAVENYLSQIAPVPFSPSFRFREEITEALEAQAPIGNLRICTKGREPIYRPHTNRFEVRKGAWESFGEIQFLKVPAIDGGIGGAGWVLHHGYAGAIPSKLGIRGLRIRAGNLQIGDEKVLEQVFPEPRFNSWAVGEIHILDPRVVPNGRRDYFERNTHLHNFLNHLAPVARDISLRCRTSSAQRNRLRHFELQKLSVRQRLAILRQGAIGGPARERLLDEIEEELASMEKAARCQSLSPQSKKSLGSCLHRLVRDYTQVRGTNCQANRLAQMPHHRRRAYQDVLGLIYDCSPSPSSAKALVDKILGRLR